MEKGTSAKLFKINPYTKSLPWRFEVNYHYIIGQPLANYHSNYYYLPPFAPESSFQTSQGFNGTFSHTEPWNQNAVDFTIPVGTPIHAARESVVIAVETDFYKNGLDKKYLPEANSIRILHNDGSMAEYAHLELEKAIVYTGMSVKAGQLIAYSGHTCFSSGPHLHFSVQYNKGMALVSVPFKFISRNRQTYVPVTGQMLTGFEFP